jgi:hypothetical protein
MTGLLLMCLSFNAELDFGHKAKDFRFVSYFILTLLYPHRTYGDTACRIVDVALPGPWGGEALSQAKRWQCELMDVRGILLTFGQRA